MHECYKEKLDVENFWEFTAVINKSSIKDSPLVGKLHNTWPEKKMTVWKRNLEYLNYLLLQVWVQVRMLDEFHSWTV